MAIAQTFGSVDGKSGNGNEGRETGPQDNVAVGLVQISAVVLFLAAALQRIKRYMSATIASRLLTLQSDFLLKRVAVLVLKRCLLESVHCWKGGRARWSLPG